MRSKALLLAIPAVLAFVTPAMAEPFGAIRVVVNRHQYVGNCPVDLVFTGTIHFTLPHPKGFVFNYHWERSDGAKSQVHVARPGPNERSMVVRERWRLGARGKAYDVSQTLFVNSGNTHLSEGSQTAHVECR
jgi:hypothetical protein